MKKTILYIWMLVLVTVTANLLMAERCVAQTKEREQYHPPPQQTPDPNVSGAGLVVSPKEDYLIGPSDLIEIKIEDAPELSGIYRLNSKGMFTMPVIGQIAAQKKRTEDLVQTITEKLKGQYLMSPIVTVAVRQSNSRAFFIQGAVRRPGIYQIEGRPSLLKLISIAGGLADNYGSTAFVMREKSPPSETATVDVDTSSSSSPITSSPSAKESVAISNTATPPSVEAKAEAGGEYELLKANINNLLRGNLDQNLLIEPGDIVHIPQTDVFFVAGEVKSPGSFPLKEGTTLRQAISLAQGTTFQGATGRSVIFRESQTGKRQEIPIDIGAVMAGKKDDVNILPNDIIIVPNSQTKTIANTLLKTFGGSLPAILLSGGILR